MGGLLTLDAFVKAFPQMDTLHTKGEQQLYNSNIQGPLPNSPSFPTHGGFRHQL